MKKYIHEGYSQLIQKRKNVIRQNRIDYKIRWEKLDWFWFSLSEYKNEELSKYDLINCFKEIDNYDQLWIYKNIKDKSCVECSDAFADVINSNFYNYLHKFEERHSDIKLKIVPVQISKQRYSLNYHSPIIFDGYTYDVNLTHDNREEAIKLRFINKLILYKNIKNLNEIIENDILKLKQYIRKSNTFIKRLNAAKNLDYVYSVSLSNVEDEKINFNNRNVVVQFQDELIPECDKSPYPLNYNKRLSILDFDKHLMKISEIHDQVKHEYFKKLQSQAWEEHLEICKFDDFFDELENHYPEIKFSADIDCNSDNFMNIYFKNKSFNLFDWDSEYYSNLDKLKQCISDYLKNISVEYENKLNIIEKIITIINSCKNKYWHCEYDDKSEMVKLIFSCDGFIYHSYVSIQLHSSDNNFETNLINLLYEEMKFIVYENDGTFRVMEGE